MKFRWIFITALLLAVLFPKGVLAAPASVHLVLKTDFRIWEVNLRYADFSSDYEKTFYRGIPVSLPDEALGELGEMVEHKTVQGLDVMKLGSYLEQKIAPAIERPREDVTIGLNVDGKTEFTGHGLFGRKLDVRQASFMIKEAIENGVTYVNLPLVHEELQVTIHEKLQEKGILELVATGETDFSGSPQNRINNIHVGLARFNGHLIAPGEEFVFGNVLGPVDEKTGYKKELVIKGDRTVPEYGGGLCQVSTTAYRAILNGGFPVTQRKNHSYAVRYYAPIGLDATVYPPQEDLKFINDSPAHLLMQTFTVGTKAYYNLYGTRDGRSVHMIGPYYYDRKSAPPAKTEYTEKLKPGETEVLGHAVPGLSSSWYREVTYADPEKKPYFESIHSKYQARPDFLAVGAEPGRETPEGRSMIETSY